MRRFAAGLLVLSLAFASESRAQPTPADESGALALGHEGLELFQSSRWDEAYDRFAAADRLTHSPVFVLYMARSRREGGQLLAARALFDRAANDPLPPNAPDPWVKAKADAAAELGGLGARIPTVTLAARGAADASFTIDGRKAEPGAPIPLDPGDHVVVASAGDVHATRKVHLAAGDAPLAVELDLTPPVAPKPTAKPPPPPPPPPPERGSVVPGAITLGVGVAGVAVGVIAGLASQSKASDVKKSCRPDGHCLASDASKADAATTLATVSTIGFVAGGIVAAGGVVLLVVRPGGSGGSGGVAVAGRF